MHKLFGQYKGLRREVYILFFGRIVTNLGSMVWPMLTMILNQKMGMPAGDISWLLILAGIILLPAGMIGGKLADRFSKRNIIVICDAVSIIGYITCACIPLSYISIALMIFSSTFQIMENPAYNALLADLTKSKDRERAYSLSYLGSNLGLMLAPVIGGFLFKNYLWLAFLLNGLSIASSTVLIFFGINAHIESVKDDSIYEQADQNGSVSDIFRRHKVLILYAAAVGLYSLIYSQYGYLMPLDLGRVHGENGAAIYGTVSSLNCVIVVLFTPLWTKVSSKLSDIARIIIAESMITAGYAVFLLLLGHIPAYYLAITLFTWGEILETISVGPYETKRIPSTHRGRVNAVISVIQSIMMGLGEIVTGQLYDHYGSVQAWIFIFIMIMVLFVILFIWKTKDYKAYPDLYQEVKENG